MENPAESKSFKCVYPERYAGTGKNQGVGKTASRSNNAEGNLKKSRSHFLEVASDKKYEFIKSYGPEYGVERMCTVLDVSRGRYYQWVKEPVGEREKANQDLVEKIRKIHEKSKQTYGSPRIIAELIKQGINCGHNRVVRLMRENGIKAKMKRRFKNTTDSNHKYPIADNILNRDFTAAARDKKWVSDITYVWTMAGWLYLCTVIDLYSRKVVGWSMDDNMETSLVLNALDMACLNRNPEPGLIFHSDRGSQYASNEFRKEMKNKGFIQSMSRRGNCWDNAVAESFFHSIKTEELYFNKFYNKNEAKSCIFEYIELKYNRMRSHSYLGYLSPHQFELSNKCA